MIELKELRGQFTALTAFVEHSEYGGSGATGKLEVLSKMWAWKDRLQSNIIQTNTDFTDEQVMTHLFWISQTLPSPIAKQLFFDAGYITLINLMSEKTEFWLCDDCRMPLTTDDEEEGCPICGDCFPSHDKRRIAFENVHLIKPKEDKQ